VRGVLTATGRVVLTTVVNGLLWTGAFWVVSRTCCAPAGSANNTVSAPNVSMSFIANS
jgi:hypothetical protein